MGEWDLFRHEENGPVQPDQAASLGNSEAIQASNNSGIFCWSEYCVSEKGLAQFLATFQIYYVFPLYFISLYFDLFSWKKNPFLVVKCLGFNFKTFASSRSEVSNQWTTVWFQIQTVSYPDTSITNKSLIMVKFSWSISFCNSDIFFFLDFTTLV